ncbi:unnamed protein product [Mytilus coruscus]|uniref:Uncharacterized protein n=1 Tax=Mytilus coruscus TaxID=42192 RepID=A0A6J8C1Q0_MYTCO|nr:unnamed protein product [Mytilus coruscus]
MPKRKKRQNVPYHRKRRGTGKSKLDKGQTEIHALTPDIAHDEDLLPSETEELTCSSVDSVSLDNSYLSDNQTVAELCLDEEIDVNQHIELECQEECVIALEDPYEALKKTVCTSLTSPSLYEGRNKRNPDLNPYNSPNDERLRWLKEDFLNYFSEWEQAVMNRVGAVALAPKRGNIHRQNDENRFVIDNSKLPKR